MPIAVRFRAGKATGCANRLEGLSGGNGASRQRLGRNPRPWGKLSLATLRIGEDDGLLARAPCLLSTYWTGRFRAQFEVG